MLKYSKVFLVDDDADDQLLFVDAVKSISEDITYTVSSTAVEAITKLKKTDYFPDIIFLDLNMPLMNGFEFLMNIKKEVKLQKIPIVIFTTSNSPFHAERTYYLGANAFFPKPASFKELCNKLQHILQKDLSNEQREFVMNEFSV